MVFDNENMRPIAGVLQQIIDSREAAAAVRTAQAEYHTEQQQARLAAAKVESPCDGVVDEPAQPESDIKVYDCGAGYSVVKDGRVILSGEMVEKV